MGFLSMLGIGRKEAPKASGIRNLLQKNEQVALIFRRQNDQMRNLRQANDFLEFFMSSFADLFSKNGLPTQGNVTRGKGYAQEKIHFSEKCAEHFNALKVLREPLQQTVAFLVNPKSEIPVSFGSLPISAILYQQYDAFNKKLLETMADLRLTALAHNLVFDRNKFMDDCKAYSSTIAVEMGFISNAYVALINVEQNL